MAEGHNTYVTVLPNQTSVRDNDPGPLPFVFLLFRIVSCCVYIPMSHFVWLKSRRYVRKLKDVKNDRFPEPLECFGEKWELNSKPNKSYVIEIWVGFLTFPHFRQTVSFQN